MSYFIGSLIIVVVIPLTSTTVYQTKVIERYVNYVSNSYISMHVRGNTEDSDGDIFLIFHKTVVKTDNYEIYVKVVDENGEELPEMSTKNNLCDQIDFETDNRRVFSHTNVFGLAGRRCPIPEGDVRNVTDVMPFEWPSEHTFDTDIGCGLHDYQVTLSKCNYLGNDCELLIKGGVRFYFFTENCENRTEIIAERLDVIEFSEEDP